WASNASAEATLAFRAQMAWLAGGDAEALAFTLRWLGHWERSTHVEGAGAELRARPALGRVLVAPWLGAVSPEPHASPRYGDVADARARPRAPRRWPMRSGAGGRRQRPAPSPPDAVGSSAKPALRTEARPLRKPRRWRWPRNQRTRGGAQSRALC